MSDNQWSCPCCGHSGSERVEINKLTARVAELEAALNEALEISERSNEQNPSNFDQELAMEHSEDICEIYHLLKALKESE